MGLERPAFSFIVWGCGMYCVQCLLCFTKNCYFSSYIIVIVKL